MTRDEVTLSLSGAVMVGNNVLRVMSDAMAGLAHLTLRYIDWLALQLLPDTAEKIWLDRHGDIWLTNADGSTGRKGATYSQALVTFTGDPGTIIPIHSQLVATGDLSFETTEEIVLGVAATEGHVRALDAGSVGNLEQNTSLALTAPPLGANGTANLVGISVLGTDQETDDELRMRVLLRIRNPPMGGAQHDYVQWALAVEGVTRAWCVPLEMGMGTASVRFMMDNLRAENQGFPASGDVRHVEEYINTVRPVAVKDIFVIAPVRYPVDFQIHDLDPDSSATRAAILDSVLRMLLERSSPGQTIFAAWKSDAVLGAIGVKSFTLVSDDDVMPSDGHLAVLGDIYYFG
jgi:uncharacterized phage protein gp47/JayE